ncbi:hypothetical protein GJ496_005908 [Pomphorhynchus laevis]|nr:hypothetical protein GJ496_005908 [Pomphorhynchus laevis]
MSLMGTKLNSLTFKVLPFCYRRIFTANYSTAASGTTSSSTSSTQLNELARKHVPNFPSEEEILARSWNKPQWERRERNHTFYGCDNHDVTLDRYLYNYLAFVLCFTMISAMFFYKYLPDIRQKVYIRREAFLELARREAAGLPLVDPNLIPEDKIILPSEEELEGVEIII